MDPPTVADALFEESNDKYVSSGSLYSCSLKIEFFYFPVFKPHVLLIEKKGWNLSFILVYKLFYSADCIM